MCVYELIIFVIIYMTYFLASINQIVFVKQMEYGHHDERTESLNVIKLAFSASKFGIVGRHRMILLSF